ncbi:sensor histidine kinase [Corynebacterium sp. AOP40-9SA-29]|uniref:sensor histidine kinase n=1 Tax=Corynebacterium sp. AOP40-9SA-29 TaxID=3457677 RepID=UPI00403385F0
MTQAEPQPPTPTERPAWIPVWVGDLAVIALILASVAVPGPGPGPAGPGGGMPDHRLDLIVTGAAVLAAALMPLRRRWPLPVLAICLAVYVGTVLLGVPALGPGIAAIVAAFAAATSVSRPVALGCGATGAILVAVLSLFTNDRLTLDPQVFQIAAGIAIATALGDSARSRREYARAATERAERAEQTREAEARRRVAEERLRIAQDLHDTVAHRISVISLNAGVASSSLDTRPDKARESLGTIREAAREVLGDIGVLLRYLRAGDSGGAGAGDTGGGSVQLPQPGVADLDDLIASITGAGLTVHRSTDGDLAGLDDTTGRVVYRVVQEGLTNAHKHGSGNTADLATSIASVQDRRVVSVRVSNPVSEEGRNQPDAPHGFLGLTGLRERVAAVGGAVTAVESDGTFTLTAELPLPREEHP